MMNRPGGQTEAAQSDSGSKSPDAKLTPTGSSRPRFCIHDVLARRRVSRQGVEHANDLAASGWPIEEIVSVLAIDPVRPGDDPR